MMSRDMQRNDNGRGNGPPAAQPTVKDLKSALASGINKGMSRIASVLPNMTADQVMQLVSIMVVKSPDLLECEPTTIVQAIVTAGALGLSINPVSGECWLVPRWDKKLGCKAANFQPGYRGLAKLMRENGEVADVQCRLVYKGDTWIRHYDPALVFKHVPDDFGDMNDEDIQLAYCHVRLKNGNDLIEVMNRKQILASRDRGRAGNSGPWVTDFAAMAKRCPIVPMSKWATLTPKLQDAFGYMHEETIDVNGEVTSISLAPKRGAGAFREKLDQRNAPEESRGLPAPGYAEPEDEPEAPRQPPPAPRRAPANPPIDPPGAPPAEPRRGGAPPAQPRNAAPIEAPIEAPIDAPWDGDPDDDIQDAEFFDPNADLDDAPDEPAGDEEDAEQPPDAPLPGDNYNVFLERLGEQWQPWFEDTYRKEGFTADQMGKRAKVMDYSKIMHGYISCLIDDDRIDAESVMETKAGISSRSEYKAVMTLRAKYLEDPRYFAVNAARVLMPIAELLIETTRAEVAMKTPAAKPAPANPVPPKPERKPRGRKAPDDVAEQGELPMNRK